LEKDADKIFSDLEERLKFFRDIGADFIFKSESSSIPGSSIPEGASPCPPSSPSGGLSEAASDIQTIHAEILRCRKCPLAAERTQSVPGEGNFRAELMFVGEGPGHDEDVQGRPFVGRAGQLLTKIIQAMKFDRAEVFITNIVKCRPPNNRVPHRDEVEICSPYLVEQIKNIRPKVIVTLGKSATDFFVPDSMGGMTAIRGRFYEWRGVPVMPTFHPSYLIRNEGNKELKRMVWDDMRMVMARLGKK
jgi:DNA polymerase